MRPGQRVAAGQLLATISNPQLVNAEQTAHDAYLAAAGRAQTAASTNATLPTTNRSNVVQAQAALEQARFNLNQAVQDQRAGAQSGLGYGGTSATQQRAAADAPGLAARDRSARSAAHCERGPRSVRAEGDRAQHARPGPRQARSRRRSRTTRPNATAARPTRRSRARRRSSPTAFARSATPSRRPRRRSRRRKANASQDKSGDVQAAQADAAQRLAEWRYAADQVARLRIVAPYAGVVQTIATQTGDSLRQLQPGDAVTAGQAVITVSADARLHRAHEGRRARHRDRAHRPAGGRRGRGSRYDEAGRARRADRRGRAEERRPVEHGAPGGDDGRARQDGALPARRDDASTSTSSPKTASTSSRCRRTRSGATPPANRTSWRSSRVARSSAACAWAPPTTRRASSLSGVKPGEQVVTDRNVGDRRRNRRRTDRAFRRLVRHRDSEPLRRLRRAKRSPRSGATARARCSPCSE